jgi:cyclic pyranopterin phosphate synthase
VIAPPDKVCSAVQFLIDQGVKKIRFTGGEPTLYSDLIEMVSFVKKLDKNIHIAITSNGVLLRSKVKSLSAAGLDSINISIDTLDPVKFKTLTGSNNLDKVISGIDAAVEHVKHVKLNCVLIRGVNENEIEELVSFANSRELDIRFIEFMPNRYNASKNPHFISGEEVRKRLPWDLHALPADSNGTAYYYSSSSLNKKVGFINPVTHSFCYSCNRIRLTANGLLYSCLYQSDCIDLFKLLTIDPARARSEYYKLVQSKRFNGCRDYGDSDTSLPSFSIIGG